MDDTNLEHNDGIELDLQRLVGAVMKRIWLVILASVLGGVLALLGTLFFVTPQYQSTAMFYVNNSTLSVGEASLSISSGDLVTSRNLVDSYLVILKTRESLLDVIDYAGVDRTYGQLRKMISASAVDDTEIFRVVVTSPDPYEAEKIANAIAYILPKRISSILEGTSAKVVDSAIPASKPNSPSYTNNTLLGFVIGLVLALGYIVLREIFDITIRTEEDIRLICPYPVLTAVPDMEAETRGGCYGNKKTEKSGADHGRKAALIGSEINFAASEAYKLLRTKLQFSFADENNCRIIGVSSAMTGEGKSLSSVNLAHTLSQLNKKVLLIDCDMRQPSIAAKLPVQKMPGLSNFLAGQNTLDSLIQSCGIPNEERAFSVIASGRIPPNPIELLSSARMGKLLQFLRQHYDYIILDLPPVGEVSDALAVAKETDGFLLVVRQNCCNRVALNDVIRQLAFVDAKILGFVYNCATEDSAGYSKKYYKKYYENAYNRNSKRSSGNFLNGDKHGAGKRPGSKK